MTRRGIAHDHTGRGCIEGHSARRGYGEGRSVGRRSLRPRGGVRRGRGRGCGVECIESEGWSASRAKRIEGEERSTGAEHVENEGRSARTRGGGQCGDARGRGVRLGDAHMRGVEHGAVMLKGEGLCRLEGRHGL